MGAPAFQFIGDRWGGAAAIEGEFGTSPFGQEYFGGDAYAPFELPTAMVESDELSHALHVKVGEIVHRRDGIIFGARKLAEVRLWLVRFMGESRATIEALLPYFQARRFYFLPDSDNPNTRYTVLWVEQEFRPEPHRGMEDGGNYDLSFTIEEVA